MFRLCSEVQMKRYKITDFKGGWFIGDFEPTLLKIKDFEVCYKQHSKGEKVDNHYHKVSTEYNCLVKGRMILNGVELNSGDVFVIEPGETSDVEFLEDCHVVLARVPSAPKDKYILPKGVIDRQDIHSGKNR